MKNRLLTIQSFPFYANSKDNVHCVQACLKSALKLYSPKKNYSFRYLDKVTKHKKGKSTWDSAMLMFLLKLGFKVISILDFDYKKFTKSGKEYLRQFWTKEVFLWQQRYGDIPAEQKLAKQMLTKKRITLLQRPATFKDIRRLFQNNYTIFCSLNPHILDHKKGYGSHLVLVTDVQKNKIIFHDSGLPPIKNRRASSSLFYRAMAYPNKSYASLIAFRK